ncbi:DUF4825 domain-containing protein [Neobacillus endophyticus]|uniref:DUF4825 domain-containing protein n=2 Tax=Neobacillus endophyticus TaxID=2738405 RepID=UPI001C26584E|nr:DUF4825 domain-containing protein [Neobacillus endophyticus]
MKKFTTYIILISLLLIVLGGCQLSNKPNQDIFQYMGSYIGNNSAVGNIITQLPQSKAFKQVTLQTKKKPYGMVIEYGDGTGNIKNSVINNATYLIALVKNVEWISFDFPNEKYTLTRQEIQQWYGKDLSDIKNEKDLKNLIQTNLKDKNKVNDLLKK